MLTLEYTAYWFIFIILTLGEKISPLNRSRLLYSFLMFLTRLTNLAAPPTGSTLLSYYISYLGFIL